MHPRWSSWTTTSLQLLILVTTLPAISNAQDALTDAQISNVRARLAERALLSWEIGTRAQALLELDAPDYSVFSSKRPFPQDGQSSISDVLTIARDVVRNQTQTTNSNGTTSTSTSTSTGPLPLMRDDSAADPASIGPAVLLAAWTNSQNQDGSGLNYTAAAKSQLEYLYSSAVPKTSDGAISHRVPEVQLWSDFVYMVPPFLAYYGVQTDNATLIAAAYEQIKLYRNYLMDKDAGNLWKHVLLGSNRSGFPANDNGHWATGNGWAAAGMLRVLATIKYSSYASSFENEQADLVNWTKEIHKAMYSSLDSTNIFTNYVVYSSKKSHSGNTSFYDAASTALMATTVYRLALLSDKYHYLPNAENSRRTLFANNSDGSMRHFTSDGPEGQAFVLMMHASHRDWVQGGSKGANSASKLVMMWGGDHRVGWIVVGFLVFSRMWVVH
ncbi:hypothetical protein L218DRAFT_1019001 [Marasmius fiardii PR-910]|nr:hypothetical protein L218DRAFT_1019001 [Marasmius fiardii PR-910]